MDDDDSRGQLSERDAALGSRGARRSLARLHFGVKRHLAAMANSSTWTIVRGRLAFVLN